MSSAVVAAAAEVVVAEVVAAMAVEADATKAAEAVVSNELLQVYTADKMN